MPAKLFAFIALFSLVAIAVTTLPTRAVPATLQAGEQAEDVVVRNVKIGKDGEVSSEVVNNSKATVRDVDVEILYSWRWNNEFRPGKDDPGRAVDIRVEKEIPPGKSVPFNYKPSPPLPDRKDGYFDISVKVVGYTRIYLPESGPKQK